MSWHGRYYRGAMREYRQRKRAAAEELQAASRERDRRRAVCRKNLGYSTRAAASLALLDCKIRRVLRGKERRREQRIYYCRTCLRYHLTSQPDRYAHPQPEGIAS